MPDFDFSKLLEHSLKIKFPNGFVGKIIKTFTILLICLTVIALFFRNIKFAIGIVGVAIVVFLIIFFSLLKFISKNPQAALLEGTEFIMHEQMEYATKNGGRIVYDKTKLSIETPIKITTDLTKIAQLPDKENLHDEAVEYNEKGDGGNE